MVIHSKCNFSKEVKNIKTNIDEIIQQISENDNIIKQLNQRYNEDLSKFSKYYNSIILYQNKNILNIINKIIYF